MVVSAQDEIYVEFVHHLLKTCVNIVLNIRIRRMLRHRLGGFVMRHNQPVIPAFVF